MAGEAGGEEISQCASKWSIGVCRDARSAEKIKVELCIAPFVGFRKKLLSFAWGNRGMVH